VTELAASLMRATPKPSFLGFESPTVASHPLQLAFKLISPPSPKQFVTFGVISGAIWDCTSLNDADRRSRSEIRSFIQPKGTQSDAEIDSKDINQ